MPPYFYKWKEWEGLDVFYRMSIRNREGFLISSSHVTVTNNHSVVEDWINRQGSKFVGLSFGCESVDELCTPVSLHIYSGSRCLVFSLCTSDYIPKALYQFLMDDTLIFALPEGKDKNDLSDAWGLELPEVKICLERDLMMLAKKMEIPDSHLRPPIGGGWDTMRFTRRRVSFACVYSLLCCEYGEHGKDWYSVL